MAAGFVSVPVIPTFKGMSKEFAQRLEKPAKASGERAGKAMSEGLGSGVENLERQVKASSSKLQDLDRAYEKSASKQAAQKEKVEAATLKLQDAEEKYQAALEKGDKGVAELAKVKEAKARLIGETEKLEQAEVNTRVAEEKHKNQLDDLQSTMSRYDQAQDELADQLGVTREELSKMGGEFSDLDAAMEDSSNKAEGWGARFAGMLKPLGKIGGIAVGLAGINSVAGTLQEGFDKVTSIEDTTASLGILMGSAEEATKVMGELEESNQNTPYSFDAWAGAGKNLIAFGVEADKTAGIVTALGEAASASGKGEEALNSMADAFGKAAASGKISMDTINSLSQGGVQGLTILANEFGVTTEEMQKMISSGQVSAEEGIDALTKGIREGSEGIAGDVASMSGVMGEMAETTSGRLTNMKSAFNNAAKSMLEELNPLIGAAAEKITDWTYAGIDLFKTYMVPAIHDGVEAAKRVMETIKPALEVTRDVLKSVVGWLKDAAEWILKNKDWISSLAVSVGVLVGSYKAWMKYQKIMAAGGFVKWLISGVKATKLWEAATKGAAAAQKVLNTVMKANPIGLIITAVTALVAGLTWFFTKTETGQELWSQFMDVLKSGWDSVKEKMSGFFDWAKDLWDSAVEKFREARETMAPVIETIQEIAQAIVEKVAGAFTWLGEKAAAAFTTVSEWIGTFLTFLQENVWPVVESILGFVGDAFTALWDGISWAWENVIQPVFNGILELAKITIGVIATVVLSPLLVAWNLLSSGIQWAWENVIQPVWQALSDFAMNTLWPALQGVFQWIGDAWQWLSDKFSAVWGWIRDTVLNPMVDAFQNTLWPAIQSVIDWIVDKWNWLSSTLSMVWGWIYQNVILRAIDGYKIMWDNILNVINWIADKWNWMSNLLSNVWGWIYQNVILRAIDGYKILWNNILDVINWIADKWNWMSDRLHAGWVWVDENVLGPFKSGLDVLKGWFRTTVDNIGRIWDGIKEKTKAPVQFVVDVVYNGGIRKAWNAVAGLVGLDKLKEIKFATGGILPGYTPGRDPYTFVEPSTGMRIGLSGGEAILRPEATRALGKDWVDNVNSAARKGGAAGVRDRLKHSHFATGGIIDLGNFAGGGFTNLAGPLSAVQKSQAAFVAKFFPGVFNLTSASRSEPGSFHDYSIQGATDWQNPATYATQMPSAESKALARAIFKNFHNSAELIHYPLDGWQNLKNGNPLDYGPGTNSQHTNHVHWATKTPIRFDGKELVLDDVPGEGGGWNPLSMVKRLWDKAMEKIGEFPGADKFGEWGKLPGAILKKLSTAAWEFVSGKASEQGAVQGGVSAGVEQWRPMVEAVLKDKGYPVSLADTVLRRMNQESGGNPAAINDWDSNAVAGTPSKGLMQVIDPTFEANKDPGYDDIFDPEANLRASMNYAVRQYGSLPAAYDRAGGYASGGIVELSKLYDQGGWLPHGGFAQNLSGKPEPIFTASQWSSLSDMIRSLGDLVPAIEGQTKAIAKAVDDTQAWLSKAGDYNSIEGINARQGVRRVLDLGIDLPGADVIRSVLDGEDALWDSRARAAKNMDAIVDKEKALQEARQAAAEVQQKPVEVSEDDQKKIDDAQKALDDAKAEQAKASSEAERAEAAEKVAKAEKKLQDTREEVDKSSKENAQKHAEEVAKANDAVAKAEQELVAAKKQQAMDLDNIVLVSQEQVTGLIPMAEKFADQMVSLGVPAAAVGAGLAQFTGGLSAMAAFIGPAGITLGMALDMLKIAISITKTIIDAIKKLVAKVKEFIANVRKARLDALKTLADGWSIGADYAKLVVDLQSRVTSLQQALIRGANEQREAEYNLMLAQHDRYIAEAEGALQVAEARLALDEEIRRGATAAQLKMMGLHEDWDSYMAYQALEAQGVLEEWSDAAISALFTYEKARAEALKGEVSARLDQIKAEAALAEAQRQNVRNQQDLLKAQERLIRMSAQVAGIELEDATGTAEIAKLMVEMAEVKQSMDQNKLGRVGAFLNLPGSRSTEYRGQKAHYDALQQALFAVAGATGANIDQGNLDRTLKLMGRTAYRGDDPMDVLRARMPELAQAEMALRVNEALKPIYDARDQRDDLARQVEDFTSEVDLYEKTTPLEHTLKGLDYTIKSLEQSSEAWADGNEELRGEYLAAAKANRDAAEAAGVDWKLDSKYANAGVRDQIRRETTIHLDGEKMYTADQIDELLAEVTAGTNGSYRIVRSASDVAVSRRKERV